MARCVDREGTRAAGTGAPLNRAGPGLPARSPLGDPRPPAAAGGFARQGGGEVEATEVLDPVLGTLAQLMALDQLEHDAPHVLARVDPPLPEDRPGHRAELLAREARQALQQLGSVQVAAHRRSEERRVGKEWEAGWGRES